MRAWRLFFYSMSLTTLLVCLSFLTVSGQEPIKCKIKDKSIGDVQYRIGGFERPTSDPEEPPELLLRISVKPEQINPEYLVLLARNINRRFCKEDRITVAIFDIYDVAVNFRMMDEYDLNAFRGEYVLDRTTGEEHVSYSTVRDARLFHYSSIKIDLKTNKSPCSM